MSKGVPGFIEPQWAAPSNVVAYVTTRKGGVSEAPYGTLNLGDHVGDPLENVLANRSRLRSSIPSEPLWLRQVHGTAVSTPNNRLAQADAIVSCVPGEVLAIMTADCLPVLFSNISGTVIGAAHAGWRGLCAGVLENTVSQMRLLSNQKDERIVAWFGPAIGPKAFEVGQDVLDAFRASGIPFSDDAFLSIVEKPGKYLANIYLLAKSRLTLTGVHQISGGNFCTVEQDQEFFSYRRDGVTGRFASLIWIK